MKPPVEQPTSTQFMPDGSSPNVARAPSSLRPPRETKRDRPFTCSSTPAFTRMPGDVRRSPREETSPASTERRALATSSK